MRTVKQLACFIFIVGAALLGACSATTSDETSGDAGACFLAFNTQFANFRTWTSFAYDGAAAGDGGVHLAGPRTVYLNEKPPHESASFPTGTMIVKEVGAADPANHHLFAMVKRGCGFNPTGAAGWEWMEIKETAGTPSIIWRGVGPPAGETYGGDPTTCNACHAACTDNDSVCASPVSLSTF